MTKNENNNYLNALKQAEAGTAIREHLKHDDFSDHLIQSLRKRSEFSTLTRQALFGNVFFWVVMITINLATALLAVKFPQLAEWIFSFSKIAS